MIVNDNRHWNLLSARKVLCIPVQGECDQMARLIADCSTGICSSKTHVGTWTLNKKTQKSRIQSGLQSKIYFLYKPQNRNTTKHNGHTKNQIDLAIRGVTTKVDTSSRTTRKKYLSIGYSRYYTSQWKHIQNTRTAKPKGTKRVNCYGN